MMSNLQYSLLLLLPCFLLPTSSIEFIPSHLKNDYGDALEAIFSLGVRLEALLHTNSSQPENFLVSPLSITLLLGQLMLGAEGRFQEHLYELLSLPQHSYNNKNEMDYMNLHLQLGKLVHDLRKNADKPRHFTLETTNALFVNKNIRLKPSFVHETEVLYETEIYDINFKQAMQAMQRINNWASDHTNGLIKDILPSAPGPNTAGIFANAIYFNGKWEQPFSSELNTVGPFYISGKQEVPTTYMTNYLEMVPYAESKRLNCKMLVLPYENRELGMYIVLPNAGHPFEYDIKSFASSTKLTDMLEMLGSLKNKDVVVKIPKLSLTSTMSLLKPLQMYAAYKKYLSTMGRRPTEYTNNKNVLDVLEDKVLKFQNFAFGRNRVDDIWLSEATIKGQLKVSDILQQMTFSVNEVGTEAAAVSAGIIDYAGGSKTFLANKPFMFFIRHEATAATLFWGSITNPTP